MSAHHDVAIERTYLKIFFVLFALTIIEVFITYIPMAKWALALILLILAFTKAGLVGAFYMHLKMEGKLLYVVCGAPILLVCLILVGMTPDIARRVGAKTKVDFERTPHGAAHGDAHGAASPAPSAAPSAKPSPAGH